MNQCPECGATYVERGESCASRFEQLLALDHSRQEPWGSRHGQAFAAFALQHPAAYPQSLDHAWAALCQLYVAHADPQYVFTTLRSADRSVPSEWAIPPRPVERVAPPSITIADLGDFAPDTYPRQLDAWCRASLTSWGVRMDHEAGS